MSFSSRNLVQLRFMPCSPRQPDLIPQQTFPKGNYYNLIRFQNPRDAQKSKISPEGSKASTWDKMALRKAQGMSCHILWCSCLEDIPQSNHVAGRSEFQCSKFYKKKTAAQTYSYIVHGCNPQTSSMKGPSTSTWQLLSLLRCFTVLTKVPFMLMLPLKLAPLSIWRWRNCGHNEHFTRNLFWEKMELNS